MFVGQVTATKIGSNLWRIEKDLTYANKVISITAKSGLKTDFASIPRLAWTLIGSPAMGRYTASSVIHDVLYMTESLSRKECDDLFLEMLEVDGVKWWRRYAMYYAVRIGGWYVWNKHTKESIQENKKYVEVI